MTVDPETTLPDTFSRHSPITSHLSRQDRRKTGADRIPRHAGRYYDGVAALKKEGKSLEEIIAAKPSAAHDSKWAGSFIMGDVFSKLV